MTTLHPVLDPSAVETPTTDDLSTIQRIITGLRVELRGRTARDLATDVGYQAHLALALAFAHRGSATGRYAEAYDAASTAIELFPLRADAYRLRGHIGFRRALRSPKWMERARRDYERAIRYDRDDAVARFGLALCWETPAMKAIESAESLRSNGKERQAQLQILDAEHRLADAVARWNDLLSLCPEHGLALFHRGACLSRLGALDEARQDLDKVCELGLPSLSWSHDAAEKRLGEAHVERARIAAAQGRYSEALVDLRMALAVDRSGSSSAVIKERALVSLKAGDLEQTIEDCSTVLHERVDLDLLRARSRAHFLLEHYDLARTDASSVLRHDDDLEARLLRARCAVALGTLESAIADLDRCLAMRPGFAEGLKVRARAHLEAGNIRSSIADARAALDLAGDDGEALFTLGCGLHFVGDERGSREALLKSSGHGVARAVEKLRRWHGVES